MMNNKKNIMYGVIGVATLMLSIVGATFAYFTATADNTATIKGNMATIDFDVSVVKMTNVDVTKKGLIPMSNNMMEQALTKNAAVQDKGICVDDNGNAVCQVYKIIVNNQSSASMFVDGYVTLFNGSGIPMDYPSGYYDTVDSVKTVNTTKVKNITTMRWAQAFCTGTDNGSVSSCTTGGNSTIRTTNTIALTSVAGTYTTLGGSTTMNKGANLEEMAYEKTSIVRDASDANAATIQGNKYEAIHKNFIRISNHASDDTTFTRTDDTTSALVYNQYLGAKDTNDNNDNGNSSSTFNDSQVYYIVVWLSENGENQTAGSTGPGASANAAGFFSGKATFISGEGSEVSATFSGLTKVSPTDTPAKQSQ